MEDSLRGPGLPSLDEDEGLDDDDEELDDDDDGREKDAMMQPVDIGRAFERRRPSIGCISDISAGESGWRELEWSWAGLSGKPRPQTPAIVWSQVPP